MRKRDKTKSEGNDKTTPANFMPKLNAPVTGTQSRSLVPESQQGHCYYMKAKYFQVKKGKVVFAGLGNLIVKEKPC